MKRAIGNKSVEGVRVFELEIIYRLRMVEKNMMESLILAQNERWRRVLSMQVER
jgi:hypothetical protein